MSRKKKKPKFVKILKHFLRLKFEETIPIWTPTILPYSIGYIIPISGFIPLKEKSSFISNLNFMIPIFEHWIKGVIVLLILTLIFFILTWLNSNWRRAKELAKDELSES